MKAPDKIFLPLFVYEKWLYQTSDTDDETEVEYIRKDALLERINKQIQFYQNSVSVNDYEEGCNKGAIAALEHIVRSL